MRLNIMPITRGGPPKTYQNKSLYHTFYLVCRYIGIRWQHMLPGCAREQVLDKCDKFTRMLFLFLLYLFWSHVRQNLSRILSVCTRITWQVLRVWACLCVCVCVWRNMCGMLVVCVSKKPLFFFLVSSFFPVFLTRILTLILRI